MRTLTGVMAAALLTLGLGGTPAVAAPSPTAAPVPPVPDWTPVDVGTDQGLRGLAAVDRKTAWVSGSAGGVWLTRDGGESWRDVSPDLETELMFRDVEATDARTAQVLAIGPGAESRILRTTDGGAHWSETFVNDDENAFYDCMAMWPGGRHGVAMSDPVDGRFRIIETKDGGASWQVVDPSGMPDAVPGEAGFAASGTCLVTSGGRDVWLASGGSASRIFHSTDRGHTWTVTDSPIPATDPAAGSSGTFSLAFRTPSKGIATGGDFALPDAGVDASARYAGKRAGWTGGGDLSGYRSGVDFLPGRGDAAIAVGPSGTDLTADGGRTWTRHSDLGYDAVFCTKDGACWASGSGGRVARLLLRGH